MYRSEVFTNKVLPAIRQIMAENLEQDYGFTQVEIARTLEISQAMVSNYLNSKAEIADKLLEDPQISLLLDETVAKAANNKEYTSEISEIVDLTESKRIITDLSEADEVI